MPKPISFSRHAMERLSQRQCTEAQVIEVIRVSPWEDASNGRKQARMNFDFNAQSNGKFYETIQVVPIFVDDVREIVVVTVMTYFF